MERPILLRGIFLSKQVINPNDLLPEIIIESNRQTGDLPEVEVLSQFPCWTCSLYFVESCKRIPLHFFNEIKVKKTPFNETVNLGKKIVCVSSNFQKYVSSVSHNCAPYEDYTNLPDSIGRVEVKSVSYYGNFCTIFCLMRYLEESYEIAAERKVILRKNMLYHESQLRGRKITHIPLAYPKTRMKMYSGEGWTEDQFKAENKALESQIY